MKPVPLFSLSVLSEVFPLHPLVRSHACVRPSLVLAICSDSRSLLRSDLHHGRTRPLIQQSHQTGQTYPRQLGTLRHTQVYAFFISYRCMLHTRTQSACLQCIKGSGNLPERFFFRRNMSSD